MFEMYLKGVMPGAYYQMPEREKILIRAFVAKEWELRSKPPRGGANG